MPEYEKVRNNKPKYEKPIVIDLYEPPIGEGIGCASGPAVNGG